MARVYCTSRFYPQPFLAVHSFVQNATNPDKSGRLLGSFDMHRSTICFQAIGIPSDFSKSVISWSGCSISSKSLTGWRRSIHILLPKLKTPASSRAHGQSLLQIGNTFHLCHGASPRRSSSTFRRGVPRYFVYSGESKKPVNPAYFPCPCCFAHFSDFPPTTSKMAPYTPRKPKSREYIQHLARETVFIP